MNGVCNQEDINMKDSSVKSMVFTGVMTAVLCVFGPLSVPIGPVPVSLATFVIYLMVYLLGMKRSAVSIGLYLLLGLIGLPVFSGYTGGPVKLFGPTGGYLIGYLFLALIGGYFIEKSGGKLLPSLLGMILATAVLYTLGTLWLAKVTGISLMSALSAGVIPFIGIDAAKMAAAAILGPVLKMSVSRAVQSA